MSNSGNLNGVEIVYLGGKSPATEEEILHAAKGEPLELDPRLIGHGPIRGTHEQFLQTLAETAKAAGFYNFLKTTDLKPSSKNPERLARAYEEKIEVGVALVSSLNAAERKKIFQDLRQDPFYESFKPPLREINHRVLAQEKSL